MKPLAKFQKNPIINSIRLCVFIVSALPIFWLAFHYYFNSLGLNPFETIMATTGHNALIFLLLSLLITPLRRWLINIFRWINRIKWGKRLSDWNILIKLRRMLGIYSFVYATLHMLAYFHLELAWIYEEIAWELNARPFINIGLICWCLLFLLTLTSPKFMQKKLKKWWRTLHRLVYPLGILACLHFWLSTKETNSYPFYYALILSVLLGHRFIVAYLPKTLRIHDDGLETKR